jgi:ribose transport system ATP-binding protein
VRVLDQSRKPNSSSMPKAVELRLTHVWKRFPGVIALKDVSFSAVAGEVHALLGENGAGKSTLMGVASGELRPEQGKIEIGEEEIGRLTSAQAQRLGLAIVHQHPAVLPDLTVVENMALAVPKNLRSSDENDTSWALSELERVGCTVHPSTRMVDLGVAQRQLIELAKALAIGPRVLVLDEPTAPLTADMVELLFEKIRMAAERGAAVIYISHRLREVRQISDRVTVMRDGEIKGSTLVNDMSDEEMLRLIVGRAVSSTFPPKSSGLKEEDKSLIVKNVSGTDFYDVSMTASGGEIVGIAGITGNGQSEFLRALAGLGKASGEASLAGKPLKLDHPDAARKAGITFLSSDRHKEGLFLSLSVRENAALSALPAFARFGVVRRQTEIERVEEQHVALTIRTPSIDTSISSLSGGNQQKVVLARALLANASLVLAEEPTTGVDVGARAEIYRILREVADGGTPVVIVSSDGHELEGLCDRVIVFSRGHVVGEFAGEEVTEDNIGRMIVTATTHRKADTDITHEREAERGSLRFRLRHFAAGDYAPSLVLVALITILAAYTTNHNSRFLSSFNIETMLILSAALAFIGYGQLCTVFTGGIDLSVGPLTGLVVVISSFFFVDGKSAPLMIIGLLLMIGAGGAIGLVNGSLVRFGQFTAVAATLGVYIVIQGISVLLRPFPAGSISQSVISKVTVQVFGVPAAFLAAIVLGIALELALRYTRWGLGLRAVGSDEQASSRIGVRTNWSIVGAFIACSVLTVLGGIMLMAEIGIGDPNQGVEYTLSSIAAVALGGASLFGGRGAFVGVLLGAVLIQEINSATAFLDLSQAWQYWFIGFLTLAAVAVYSQARRSPGES